MSERNLSSFMTHIQRFSLHDGPGIRTTVFFKGCPLHCPWCCNPECIRPHAELMFQRHMCLGVEACGLCLTACSEGCFYAKAERVDSVPVLHRQACTLCMRCTQACPTKALMPVGTSMTAAHILDICRKDQEMFTLSHGGLTLSGGEPLARPDITAQVLNLARADGIHTAIETCGWFDMDNPSTQHALAHCDLCILDLKHMDTDVHTQHTGVGIERIHGNLRRMVSDFPRIPIQVRITVIPHFNATEAVIMGLAHFATSFATVQSVELIPYHSFGASKYAHLGRPAHWQGAYPSLHGSMALWQERIDALPKASRNIEVAHDIHA